MWVMWKCGVGKSIVMVEAMDEVWSLGRCNCRGAMAGFEAGWGRRTRVWFHTALNIRWFGQLGYNGSDDCVVASQRRGKWRCGAVLGFLISQKFLMYGGYCSSQKVRIFCWSYDVAFIQTWFEQTRVLNFPVIWSRMLNRRASHNACQHN